MPWKPSARLRHLRQLAAVAVVLLLCGAGAAASAQNIESLVAPGKLIQGHAKWEDDCKQCHVRFDRKAQDGLCMDCHKNVGIDMRAKTGFHGRLKPQACKSCHSDHKGRDARIAAFDRKTFDHRMTDFALHGKHGPVECDKCHAPGKKFSSASSECSVCHKKDDAHKEALGQKCANCHNENNWKDAKFDHGTARFVLTGKHQDVKCADCHKSGNYREAPRNCVGCHRKDDDSSKGHRGQFGDKCDSCHGTQRWKPSTFNHDTDTRYALRGKHRSSTCADCHTGPLYRTKLSAECVSCHRKDDKHKETLGKDCASCHSERNWTESPKFDHDATSFPLLGRHAKTECKQCHRSPLFEEAPKRCVACHQKEDKHLGTLGDNCGACHGEKDWKTTQGRFDHNRTRFALKNAHAASTVKCGGCHKGLNELRHTPLECLSCHKKDDKHEGQQGATCEQCHSDRSWKVARFDHARTRYPLTGRHSVAACQSCHTTQRFKDAQRECYACHKKEDTHQQRLGQNCQSCHNTRAWSLWDFDHTRQSKYPLEGAHQKLACEHCHTVAAPANKAIAPVATTCVSCHRSDDVHDAQFGARCEQCHAVQSWKKLQSRLLTSQP